MGSCLCKRSHKIMLPSRCSLGPNTPSPRHIALAVGHKKVHEKIMKTKKHAGRHKCSALSQSSQKYGCLENMTARVDEDRLARSLHPWVQPEKHLKSPTRSQNNTAFLCYIYSSIYIFLFLFLNTVFLKHVVFVVSKQKRSKQIKAVCQARWK